MKKLSIIFAMIFTFTICCGINYKMQKFESVSQNMLNSKYNIVIDAGHGGKDAGTIGIDGTEEKTINLAIAKKLYDYFMVCGINTYLIRNGDYEFYNILDDKNRSDLYNRLDYINSIEKSMLISIHQNHFENENEWGMQVWYSGNTTESQKLADSVLNVSKDFLQKDNKRENKQSDNSYYLLYRAKVPSIMVECGFMSNSEENKKLQDDNYQNYLAYSIMVGVNDFLNGE